MPNYNQNLLVLKGRKYALMVLSLFFLGTVIWIIIALFSTQQQTSVEKTVLEAAKPLKPYLNTAVLDEIAKKAEFSREELKSFPIRVFNYDAKTREKSLQIINEN